MANATRFHEWLKTELAARGFHEWGGMSAFARQCGVHASVVSRALNGRAVPEIDVLRRFGHVLGRTLGEMLVAAGVAEP
ncbi:MAG: helix-turn-helix transcriptional regulator, partial [Nonomuraea sp.]|nr:helix-turn-helix transcriptional regulator [Nonomuraea sp.]